MRLRIVLLLFCLALSRPILFAQTGVWGDLLSYYALSGFSTNGKECLAIGRSTLLRYNIETGERTRYSKLRQLSSADIREARLLDDGSLWVSYLSGRVDYFSPQEQRTTIIDLEELVKRGERSPLIDFLPMDATTVVGISSDNVYIFQNQKLHESYPLWSENRANALTLTGGLRTPDGLYFATTDGVYQSQDLLASKRVERVGALHGAIHSLVYFSNQLIAVRLLSVGYELLIYDAGNWRTLVQRPYALRGRVWATAEGVFVPEVGQVCCISFSGQEKILFSDQGISPSQQYRVVGGYTTPSGATYLATAHRGLLCISSSGEEEMLSPVSPAFISCGKLLALSEEEVVLTNNDLATDKTLALGAPFLFFRSAEGQGENIYLNEKTAITSLVLLDSAIGRYAIGTTSAGLFIFERTELKEHYTPLNSPLPSQVGNMPYINTLEVAPDGTLYVVCKNTLCRLLPNKEWQIAKLPKDYSTYEVFLRWMPRKFLFLGSTAFTEVSAIDPELLFRSAGKQGFHSQFLQGEQQFHGVVTLAMDINSNADVLLGTNNGLVYARNPMQLLKDELISLGGVYIHTPKKGDAVLFEGIAIDYLLNDSGDRLWVSRPNRGLMLVSPSQKLLLEEYTEGNSALPSNKFTALGYEPRQGKLYIATSAGVVSLLTDAKRSERDYSSVTIYPNPVRPDFLGVLTIDGLVKDSYLKILDSGGELVCELQSNGGRATWDLCNGAGNPVASGVYFVLISDPLVTGSYAGKFVVIR